MERNKISKIFKAGLFIIGWLALLLIAFMALILTWL